MDKLKCRKIFLILLALLTGFFIAACQGPEPAKQKGDRAVKEEKTVSARQTPPKAPPAVLEEVETVVVAETPAPPLKQEISDPDFPLTLSMDNPAYTRHAKPIVEFTHARHSRDYGLTCGQCHHDDKGAPIEGLKEGDTVKPCLDCHSLPKALSSREKRALKPLSATVRKEKRLSFHAEAMHMQCVDCHKAWNKEHGKSAKDGAPKGCKACHKG